MAAGICWIPANDTHTSLMRGKQRPTHHPHFPAHWPGAASAPPLSTAHPALWHSWGHASTPGPSPHDTKRQRRCWLSPGHPSEPSQWWEASAVSQDPLDNPRLAANHRPVQLIARDERWDRGGSPQAPVPFPPGADVTSFPQREHSRGQGDTNPDPHGSLRPHPAGAAGSRAMGSPAPGMRLVPSMALWHGAASAPCWEAEAALHSHRGCTAEGEQGPEHRTQLAGTDRQTDRRG